MRNERKREQGMALFMTVLILVLMASLAIAGLRTVARDREVAGHQNRSRSAFYAADAASAQARAIVREMTSRTALPPFPDSTNPKLLGDLALYDRESRQPRFYGDPSVADPIRYTGESAVAGGEGFNLSVKGQKLSSTFWQINVTGESATGDQARLEVVEVKVLASGY
jgi:Tfp pilus assembly protein PilX